MSTYTFRRVTAFNVPNVLTINNSSTSTIRYGSIERTQQTVMFGNQTWTVFNCTRNHRKEDVIWIDDMPVDSWETRDQFTLYLNARQNLLVAQGPSKVVKGLLDRANKVCDEIDITALHFNFDTIAGRLATVQQAWVSVNEAGLTSVGYMGTRVRDKAEVQTAIAQHHASYLGTVIDIDGIGRAMGFSQKGAIILINANQPMSELEKLNLAFTTYRHVTEAG